MAFKQAIYHSRQSFKEKQKLSLSEADRLGVCVIRC